MLALAQMVPERVGVDPLQPSEDVREGQLLEPGMRVHGLSVGPPIPSEVRVSVGIDLTDEEAPTVSIVAARPTGPSRALLHRAGWALASLGLVIVVSALVMVASLQGRALPNTSVDGVPVGRMDRATLERTLTPIATESSGARAVLITPGSQIVLGPERSDMRIDVDATVTAVLDHGRSGAPSDVVAAVRALRIPQDIPFVVTLDEAAIAAWVADIAADFDRIESVGDLIVDPVDLDVRVIGPEGAQRVVQDATTAALISALRSISDAPVDLVFVATPPPAPRTAIEELAEAVRAALMTPLVLVHDGRRLVVEPQLLAPAIAVGEGVLDGARTPVIAIGAAALPSDLIERARSTFERPAIDARFIVPQRPALVLDERGDVTFRPERVDIGLDAGQSEVHVVPSRLAQQLGRMVAAGSTLATAELFEQPAAFDGGTAQRGRPTHLVGTFTTYFTAGAARNLNIARLAATLDGTLVAPGDELSVNRISGPRRCEDGYVPAGTIVRGELVDTCGGGVSQFGTTIYNAAFFAGLPIPQWQAHSFFISRYPTGREATLSYPELDVRFVNDSDGFIVVRTSTSETSITVSLYGVLQYAAVGAIHSAPRDPTTFSTIERGTAALAPGARHVVQPGGGGFTVDVHRVWTALPDGEAPAPVRVVTVYRPQQRIIEIGVSTAPPTAPAPTETAGD